MDFDQRDAIEDHKHDRLDELGFGSEGRRVMVSCAQCQKDFECWRDSDASEPLCNECLFEL